MATLIGLRCCPPEDKGEGRKTKISGGQRKANKESREWAGDGENPKINRCNYEQEHQGGRDDTSNR